MYIHCSQEKLLHQQYSAKNVPGWYIKCWLLKSFCHEYENWKKNSQALFLFSFSNVYLLLVELEVLVNK